MNVVCIYWKGDFRGRDLSAKDVWNLCETVDKHMDRPYRFYCLTNDMQSDTPGEKISLKHNWPGWWSKVELHRPDLPLGRTLYLDLDSYVISSLKPILDFPGDLVMFPTKTPQHKIRNSCDEGLVHCYQSSVMLFDPGTKIMVDLYDRFKKDSQFWISQFRSEQDMMGKWIPNQPMFPDEWLLKLASCRGIKEPSKDVIIVTGQPRDTNFRDAKYAPWLERRAR